MPQLDAYDRLAELIKIQDIMVPIFSTVPADMDISDAVTVSTRGELFGEMKANPVLVTSGGRSVGWTSWSEMNEAIAAYIQETGEDEDGNSQYGICEDYPGICVRSVMLDISPSEIITADTPLLEASALLGQVPLNARFFVMDGIAIVGTVCPANLDHPLFKAALLGLLLEVEDSALELARCEPYTSWTALTPERQTMAFKAMERSSNTPCGDLAIFQGRIGEWRHNRTLQNETNHISPASDALQYTNFIDKKIILSKRSLLASWPEKRLASLFNQAEKVRNSLAHGRGFIGQIKSGTMADFLGLLRELLDDLRRAAAIKRQDWKLGLFPSDPSR